MSATIINFVVAGTQKGGTTALRSYLREHPQICISNLEEPHFFDNEGVFQSEDVDYSQYHSYFTPFPNHIILGEVTPIYMYWRPSMRRIYEYNPEMKIIIILRNPIERAYSHWNMERDRGYDADSFWHAIKKEKRRCREALPHQHRKYSYVDRGFYFQQLQKMWSYFPQKQTLILRNEDLMEIPEGTLNRLCSFLNITDFASIEKKRVHARPYKSFLGHKEWKYLKNIYESEIAKLESILGWDCQRWLDYEHYKSAACLNHAGSTSLNEESLPKKLGSFLSSKLGKSTK